MGGLFLEFLTLMSEDREIERFFFIVIPAKAGIHSSARAKAGNGFPLSRE
jgi:hypothetical protein